jgi:hypothetical protein
MIDLQPTRKDGWPPSVPGIFCAWEDCSERIHRFAFPFLSTVAKTIREPSGETEGTYAI